ncbi:MAG: AMP-binding protein [Bacteroidota bacterium]
MAKLYFKDLVFDTSTVHPIAEDCELQLKRALVFINNWNNNSASFVFSTSGSTGIAKEIMSSRKEVEASASATIQFLKLKQDSEHVLICLQMHTVAAAIMLARALMLNADITLCEASSNPLLQVDSSKISFASFVPLQVESTLKNEVTKAAFQKINHVILGGAALSYKLESELATFKNHIWHSYGMTETLSHIALRRVGKEKAFRPMPLVELALLDNSCLMIKAPVCNNEWIKTNDVATIHQDGSFEILGRSDFVINSGAYKIHPERVEEAIQKLWPFVHSFFVGAVEDNLLTLAAVLAVECNDETEQEKIALTFDKIKSDLQGQIHKYEIPKRIIFVEKIFYSQNLKLDRIKSNQALHNQML